MIIESLGDEAVWVAALHLGVSIGWHTGTGIRQVEEMVNDDNNYTFEQVLTEFLKKSLHHYDVGFFIIVISLGLFIGVTDWDSIILISLFGYGGGLVYSDKKNNPPEGIVKHIIGILKNA